MTTPEKYLATFARRDEAGRAWAALTTEFPERTFRIAYNGGDCYDLFVSTKVRFVVSLHGHAVAVHPTLAEAIDSTGFGTRATAEAAGYEFLETA